MAVATLLLSEGADVNARMTRRAHTPLHRAVECGNLYQAEFLVFQGGQATGPDPLAGESPLQMAVRRRDKAMVAVLTAQGLFPPRQALRLGLGDKRRVVAVVNGDVITASDVVAYAGGGQSLFESDSLEALQDPDRLPAILDRVQVALAASARELVALRLLHWAATLAGVQVPPSALTKVGESLRRRLRLPPGELGLASQGSGGPAKAPDRLEDLALGRPAQRLDPLRQALHRLDWTADDVRRVCTWQAAADLVQQACIAPGIALAEKDVREFYEQHPEQFTTQEQLRLQVIALASASAAGELLRQLREGADFAALARAHSTHAGAGQGGDRGWVQTAGLRTEFRDAFTELKPGSLAGPVTLDGKTYLLRISEMKAPGQVPLETAAEDIRRRLREAELARRRAEVVAVLAESAEVESHIGSP
jgi:parvulin-like peptidyl-prolyl isomerase